jgi:hypothetical protein
MTPWYQDLPALEQPLSACQPAIRRQVRQDEDAIVAQRRCRGKGIVARFH